MAIELVSYTDLKSFLGLEGATIATYPDLSIIRDSVTYSFESYLGRKLEYSSYEENIYVSSVTSIIKLDALPIDEVSVIQVTEGGVVTNLSSDMYEVMNYGIYLFNPVFRCKVFVEYDGGYVSTDVPYPIKRAALLQTAMEFQTKDHIGASTVSTEGGMTQRPQLGLLKEVTRLLTAYKHPLIWS